MNKSELKKHKSHALTDEEVVDLVKGKAKVVPYDQLHRFKNIDELLKPHNAVFILYQQQKNFGHWVALFKRKSRKGNVEINYFDPYGNKIDEPLLWTSKAKREELNMNYPYLTELLLDAPRGYDINYNEHKFQKQGEGINTCGRHGVLRLQNKDLTLNQYVKMFEEVLGKGGIKSQKTDDLVTSATMFEI